jgi:hypothetical protein
MRGEGEDRQALDFNLGFEIYPSAKASPSSRSPGVASWDLLGPWLPWAPGPFPWPSLGSWAPGLPWDLLGPWPSLGSWVPGLPWAPGPFPWPSPEFHGVWGGLIPPTGSWLWLCDASERLDLARPLSSASVFCRDSRTTSMASTTVIHN